MKFYYLARTVPEIYRTSGVDHSLEYPRSRLARRSHNVSEDDLIARRDFRESENQDETIQAMKKPGPDSARRALVKALRPTRNEGVAGGTGRKRGRGGRARGIK